MLIWRQEGVGGGRSSNYLLSGTGLSDSEILERGEGWELAWQTFQQIHRIFWFWEWLHPFVKSSDSAKGGGWDCSQQTFQMQHLKDFKPNLRICKGGVGWECSQQNLQVKDMQYTEKGGCRIAITVDKRNTNYAMHIGDFPRIDFEDPPSRGERIVFSGPNTNTNTIRLQKRGRIRIRILFGFRNMAEYEY